MQKNNEEELPPYIQYYVDKLGGEGYSGFVEIARAHKKEQQDYDELIYPRQLYNLRSVKGNENKTIDQDAVKAERDARYEKRALEYALEKGYVPEESEEVKDTGKEKIKPETIELKQDAPLCASEIKRQEFKNALTQMQLQQSQEKERD